MSNVDIAPVPSSDIRQVPDTQELLLFPNSNISIVLEVLEKVAADDLVEAVKSVPLFFMRLSDSADTFWPTRD
jgi:hypothetical protein